MSSSRLGLRATELLSVRTALPRAAWSVQLKGQAKGFSTTSQCRAGVTRAALEHSSGRLAAQPAPKMQLTKRMQQNMGEMTAEALSIILPGACIPDLGGQSRIHCS